jgi:hypothetical protein
MLNTGFKLNIKLTETGTVETVLGNIPEIPEGFFFIPEEIQNKDEELDKARRSFLNDLRHDLEFFAGCKVRKNINRMEERLETAVNSDKYTVAETDKLRADIDALKKAASGFPTSTTTNTFTRVLAWSINPTIPVKMAGMEELIAALKAAYVSGTTDSLKAARNALMTFSDGFAPSEKSRIARHTCKMALKRSETGKYSVQELTDFRPLSGFSFL